MEAMMNRRLRSFGNVAEELGTKEYFLILDWHMGLDL